RSARTKPRRRARVSNRRAPTSAWRWKVTLPSLSMTRVDTLPMSCSRAAQRTMGWAGDCMTTCLVCSHTSLCRRPASCERFTVASNSGSTCCSTPASCSHRRPSSACGAVMSFSRALRTSSGGNDPNSPATARAASVISVGREPPLSARRQAMSKTPAGVAPNGTTSELRAIRISILVWGDLLLVLVPLPLQVVQDRLGLLEPTLQGLFADRIVGAEFQSFVVQESADFLIVDEQGNLLARVHGLAQDGPAAVEPGDQIFAAGPLDQLQFLAQTAEIFGEAVAERRRPFAPVVENLAQGQPKDQHVLAVSEVRLDVPVAGCDDVHDRSRRDFARAMVQIGVGHRFEQDLEIEGERNQGPRKNLQQTALYILLHGRQGAGCSWIRQPGPVGPDSSQQRTILPNSLPIDRGAATLHLLRKPQKVVAAAVAGSTTRGNSRPGARRPL